MIAPVKTKTVRCAAYTRKSTEEGLQQAFNTLDAQRESCEAYVTSQKAMGWVCLPDRYDDGGFSGGTLERPALDRLLSDIAAGQVDCVVVYKVDRLSRSLLDFSRLVEVFDAHGVSFVSVTQPINTADSTGRLMLNILLSFAQYERELIRDRTRDKAIAARKRGKWTGGIPVLGYDIAPEGCRLVVNEDEAPMVREMFSLYQTHRSLSKVAAELQRRGWTTKSWVTRKGKVHTGGPFSKSTLARHLANVTYAGMVNHKGHHFPAEHPGIVPKRLFDEVQEILAGNLTTGRHKARNKYGALLRGLVRCKACDAAYVTTATRKGAITYRYYVCGSAQKRGWHTCPRPSLPAQKLEQLVVDQIRGIGQDPKLQAETLRQVRRTAKEQDTALAAEEKSLRKKLDAAKAEEAGLVKALAGGDVAPAAVSLRLAQLEDEGSRLATRLAEIAQERAAAADAALCQDDLTAALGLFTPVWDPLYPAERARIIELLVERVEVDGAAGTLAVTFHPTGIKDLAAEVAQEVVP
ncbi:MAG: recombinase family protein [Krumholzibacteria bacterium]|nr:recombinase family protein [Candidatus Krumholzibacteria bacterium]